MCNQGRCAAQGTFSDLNNAGLDFWNLVHASKTPEKQLDDIIDEELNEELNEKRRFSRVLSCEEPIMLRKRAKSFGRQISSASRCTFGESTATVANDVSECIVYVSIYFSNFWFFKFEFLFLSVYFIL